MFKILTDSETIFWISNRSTFQKHKIIFLKFITLMQEQ